MSETTTFDDKAQAAKNSLTKKLAVLKRRDFGANLLDEKLLIFEGEVVVLCEYCNAAHTIIDPVVPTIWRCRNVACRSRNHTLPAEPDNIPA